MITLYGIPNCDTMKKSRQWLADHDIDYVFHDYKKSGVPEKELKHWVKELGWETVLNRSGTTWRKLDDAIKNNINQSRAIQVMLQNPSCIKRPILDADGKLQAGFAESEYRKIFGK